MYTSALEFLEDEREAWRPYEALAELSDSQLERPSAHDGPGHGWSGRELIGHMIGWMEVALTVARELAVNERSPAKVEADRDWAARGDAVNEELHAAWRDLPMSEVRQRFATVPGELRGTLTVVPEARWIKDADMHAWFVGDLIEHDEEHVAELEAILAKARGG